VNRVVGVEVRQYMFVYLLLPCSHSASEIFIRHLHDSLQVWPMLRIPVVIIHVLACVHYRAALQASLQNHTQKRIFSNTFASEETDEKRGSRQPEVVQYWRH
jgi:hypothetical protein